MDTVFSTSGVRQEDAAAYWLDHSTSAYCPHVSDVTVSGTVLHPEVFFAEGRHTPLGEAAMTSLEMRASRLDRLARHIRSGGEEIVYAVTPVMGEFSFEQHGRLITVRTGDLYLEDTRYPFRIQFGGHAKAVGLAVPAQLLSQRIGSVDRLGGTVIRRGDGLGKIAVRHMLTVAEAETSQVIASDVSRLQDVTLDLAAMAFGQAASAAPQLHAHPDTAGTRLLHAMLDQLDDPDATAESIARAAAMSPRYARSLMAGLGTTVGRRLREMRLERAATMLADPDCAQLRIIDIGLRCGFSDPSHFARRFREAHGLTPMEYRRAVRDERAALGA